MPGSKTIQINGYGKTQPAERFPPHRTAVPAQLSDKAQLSQCGQRLVQRRRYAVRVRVAYGGAAKDLQAAKVGGLVAQPPARHDPAQKTQWGKHSPARGRLGGSALCHIQTCTCYSTAASPAHLATTGCGGPCPSAPPPPPSCGCSPPGSTTLWIAALKVRTPSPSISARSAACRPSAKAASVMEVPWTTTSMSLVGDTLAYT